MNCLVCSSLTLLKCQECHEPFCSVNCQRLICARGETTQRKESRPKKDITDYLEVNKIQPVKKFTKEQISKHVVFYTSTKMPPIYRPEYFKKYENFPIKKKIGEAHEGQSYYKHYET